MARPQQRELARNEKVPGLSPDASETELSARPDLEERGRTGPVPADNLPGHHPAEEQDKPDGADFLAKLQGEDQRQEPPAEKAAKKAAKVTAKKAGKTAATKKAAAARKTTAQKAAAPVKKIGAPPEPAPIPAALADAPSGEARATRTPAAAGSPRASTTRGRGGIDPSEVREVAVKLVFWPVTVGVWAGKQVWRRLTR